MNFIAIDFETANSNRNSPCEIGIVKVENFKITDKKSFLIRPKENYFDWMNTQIHGIDEGTVENEPEFDVIYSKIKNDFEKYPILAHNASFDIGFINHESKKLRGKHQPLESKCRVIDTLALARQRHPGQKNNLDALCKRYGVDNSQRQLHGALLDAEILADVYLLMTGGQVNLNINDQSDSDSGEMNKTSVIRRLPEDRPPLRVVKASDEEIVSHEKKLSAIVDIAGQCVWQGSGE